MIEHAVDAEKFHTNEAVVSCVITAEAALRCTSGEQRERIVVVEKIGSHTDSTIVDSVKVLKS